MFYVTNIAVSIANVSIRKRITTINGFFFRMFVQDLTEGVFLMISFCNFIYKITIFFLHLKRTKSLCLRLDHTIFQPRNSQEEQ